MGIVWRRTGIELGKSNQRMSVDLADNQSIPEH